MQFIETFFVPLLKAVIFSPTGIVKILMRVPLSEAVANKVPHLLIDIQAKDDSCAFNNFFWHIVLLKSTSI